MFVSVDMITHLIRAPAVRGPVLCSRYASRRLDQTGLHVRVVHSVHANAMPSCARFSLTSPSPSLRSMTTIDTHSDSPSQRARCGATVLCLLRAHGCTRHSASLLLVRSILISKHLHTLLEQKCLDISQVIRTKLYNKLSHTCL